ncbi:MAG: hypothetical protein QW775_03450 [Ignisphaera sp.]|uniref:Uncharacterized protein n=1 Tax=Ignisphaera aggregans TaxID=334771 RepID=A0A7C4NLU8_9CREN
MGRNTSSLRIAVARYVERIKKLSEVLPPEERQYIEEFLQDLETTLSLCSYTGVADPLEVLFFHFIRKLVQFKAYNTKYKPLGR